MKTLGRILLVVFTMFFWCNGVNAEKLVISDIVDKFNEISMNSAVVGNDNLLMAKVIDNQIDIFNNDKLIFSLNYTEDYIEYKGNYLEINSINYNNVDFINCALDTMMRSIFSLCGYNNVAIVNYDKNIIYENYGLWFEIDDYNVKITDDTGKEKLSIGDMVKYFKIGLDKNLILELINDCGVNVDKVVPSLMVERIDGSVAVIYSSLGESNEFNVSLVCNVYRSTSIDGDYELIPELSNDCNNKDGVVDRGLEVDKNYYYRVEVVGLDKYSDSVAAITLKDDFNSSKYSATYTKDNMVSDGATISNLSVSRNYGTDSLLGYVVSIGVLFGIGLVISIMFKYLDKSNNVI